MSSSVDDYDELFDAWGKKMNVNPQLAKTVFWMESSGNPNIGNGNAGEIGPMQMKLETAAAMARKLGYDPRAMDLHDMRWAVPLAMQYMADGLNATQSVNGMFGYYNSGSADPRHWKQDYVNKALQSYPNMALKLSQPSNAAPADEPQQAP